MTRMTAIRALVALAAVCPWAGWAHADTLFVGAPEHAKLEAVQLRVDSVQGRAILELELSSAVLVAHPSAAMIEVPRGARVIGMTVTIGGTTASAQPLDASLAAERFAAIVERREDPALLEHVESNRRHDRLRLSVFPIAKTSPARVALAIDLPVIEKLTLDVESARVEITLDEQPVKSRTIALPAQRSWMMHDPVPRKHVSMFTSLLADTPAPVEPVTITIGQPMTGCFSMSVSPKDIRRRVKLAHPRLRQCYVREAQRDPTLAGTGVLHFTIGTDGATTDISVDGTLQNGAVRACLAAEVATWRFHAGDVDTRVNYPLTFRLER